ncbi:MAG TPA: hypothetical protein VLG71_01425, partial [Candidatus Limnocylindria bacterium]|nr:hypothetical protein [Candidatus Limnocylindria bacterium]
DTVIFNIKELKANSPNYALPKSWSEKDNGKTYGSFFHEAKPDVGSLNDYETIEIERASNWELANILKQSKFFTLTGIKTENGREVRVTLY